MLELRDRPPLHSALCPKLRPAEKSRRGDLIALSDSGSLREGGRQEEGRRQIQAPNLCICQLPVSPRTELSRPRGHLVNTCWLCKAYGLCHNGSALLLGRGGPTDNMSANGEGAVFHQRIYNNSRGLAVQGEETESVFFTALSPGSRTLIPSVAVKGLPK